jgi:signal transduction histidine kinase
MLRDGGHVVPVTLHLQLLKAREAADAAKRAKSEFLANLSHEVRTTMYNIIGMTDAILASELEPEQRDDLNAVKESANSMLKIIDDTFEFL